MSPPDAPDWTDANRSDPGLSLLELFAYLADFLSSRQDSLAAEKRRQRVTLVSAAAAGAVAGVLACRWHCSRRVSAG